MKCVLKWMLYVVVFILGGVILSIPASLLLPLTAAVIVNMVLGYVYGTVWTVWLIDREWG